MNAPTDKRNKIEWLHLLMIAGMFVASAICWNSAPDEVPLHWNALGEVDRHGGKLEGLLLLPVVALGLYLLMRFIPRLDPGQLNYDQFKRSYSVIRLMATGVMVAIHAAVLAYIFGYHADMGLVGGGAIGLLMIVIGNLMGKIRPNWFVGIRTPWTLSSKRSWSKTHRVGGRFFVAIGITILIAAIFKSTWAIPTALVSIIVSILGLVVYSWFVWRNDPDRVLPAGTSPATGEK